MAEIAAKRKVTQRIQDFLPTRQMRFCQCISAAKWLESGGIYRLTAHGKKAGKPRPKGRKVFAVANPDKESSLLGGLILSIEWHLPDSALLLAGFFERSSLLELLQLDHCCLDDQINWLGAVVPLLIRSDPNPLLDGFKLQTRGHSSGNPCRQTRENTKTSFRTADIAFHLESEAPGSLRSLVGIGHYNPFPS